MNNSSRNDYDIVYKAYGLAQGVHKNEKRADGRPYMVHIDLVKRILEYWNSSQQVIAAGILHDTLESDPKVDLNRIDNYVCDLVLQLTRQNSSSYLEYLLEIKNTATNIDVLRVKRADMIANYYDILHYPPNNRHQYKHLKTKLELSYYILFADKIWNAHELAFLNTNE